ncbi:hypothetical protein HK101_010438 [Irineochytrium annulatum]|nr:hypothetical protein HK101_010438 [Irineochytrium annulatum]
MWSHIADAKNALQESPGAIVDGRQIRVEPANVVRTLFITKIGIHMDQSDVTHIAERFGPVEDVTLLRFSDTGKSRGSSRVVTVDPGYIDATSVFVGKINPEAVTHEKLRERFNKYGVIAAAKLVMPNANPPGNDDYLNGGVRHAFAFITFGTPGSAELAADGENGTEWLGRIIKVELREINRRMRSSQSSPVDGTKIPVTSLQPSQVLPVPVHASMNGYCPPLYFPQQHLPYDQPYHRHQYNSQQPPHVHAAILPGTHQPQNPNVTSPNISSPAPTVASAAFVMQPLAAQRQHQQPHQQPPQQHHSHGVHPLAPPPAGMNYYPNLHYIPDTAHHPHARSPDGRTPTKHTSDARAVSVPQHAYQYQNGAPQGVMVQTGHGPAFVMYSLVYPPQHRQQEQQGQQQQRAGVGRQEWEVGKIEEVVYHSGKLI